MASQIDGLALGAVAAGGLFVYAGIKGVSVPALLSAVITGKNPAALPDTEGILGVSGSGASGSSPSGPQASAGKSEQSFFTAFLHDLGARVTQANLGAMDRWAAKEEPSFPPPNAWNPLNIKGSGGGFAQYGSSSSGAFMTAAFMINNNYSAIVSSLRTGNGIVDSPQVAAELSAWSGGGYTSVNSGGG